MIGSSKREASNGSANTLSSIYKRENRLRYRTRLFAAEYVKNSIYHIFTCMHCHVYYLSLIVLLSQEFSVLPYTDKTEFPCSKINYLIVLHGLFLYLGLFSFSSKKSNILTSSGLADVVTILLSVNIDETFQCHKVLFKVSCSWDLLIYHHTIWHEIKQLVKCLIVRACEELFDSFQSQWDKVSVDFCRLKEIAM